MNKTIKKQIYNLSSFIPLDISKKIYSNKIIFPFYHAVTDQVPAHLKNLYPIKNVKQFSNDLDFLLKKYKVIDFEQVKNIINGNLKLNKPAFFVTFDDGLSQVFDIIAPILKQKGIPSAFFINSDFVDNKKMFFKFKMTLLLKIINQNKNSDDIIDLLKKNNLFRNSLIESFIQNDNNSTKALTITAEYLGFSFEDYLKNEKPYLTLNQSKKLSEDGFLIGAHSASHPLYKNISTEKQLEETVKSLEFVQKNFNPKYKLFAFPFTDHAVNLQFFEKLFATTLIDFSFGTAGLKNDAFPKNIQRIPMENLYSIKSNLKYEYLYYFIKMFFNKNTIKRTFF